MFKYNGMLVVLFTTLIVACSRQGSPDGLFEDYHYRMSNIIDSDIVVDAPADQPRYPSRRQLVMELPQAKLDLLEYLRLSPCDLQRLVGKRNSSLGRVMMDSQRLIYEIEFIQLAGDCLEQLRARDAGSELRQKLQQAVNEKRRHLLDAAWNATFAGEEFGTLFSVATQSMDIESVGVRPNLLLESIDRLEHRLRPLSQGRIVSMKKIEQELAVIGAGKYAGQLLQSLILAERYLRGINRAMAARLARAPLCFNDRPNPRAVVWRNVFYKHYIGRVQPYLAALHQRAGNLSQVVEPLLGAFAPLPDPVSDYWQSSFGRDGDTSTWRRFEQSLDRHIRLWQDALSQCGMMPGAGQ